MHAVLSFDAASDAAESSTAALQQDSEPLHQQAQQHSSGLPRQSQLKSDQLPQQVHAVLSFDAASDAAESSTAALQHHFEPLHQQVQQQSSGLPRQSQLKSDQLTQQVHAALSFDAASGAPESSTAALQQHSEPLHQQAQQHSSGLPRQSQLKSDQLPQQVHAVLSFDAASDAPESSTAALQQDSEPLHQQV